jgi:hypothetical protein
LPPGAIADNVEVLKVQPEGTLAAVTVGVKAALLLLVMDMGIVKVSDALFQVQEADWSAPAAMAVPPEVTAKFTAPAVTVGFWVQVKDCRAKATPKPTAKPTAMTRQTNNFVFKFSISP